MKTVFVLTWCFEDYEDIISINSTLAGAKAMAGDTAGYMGEEADPLVWENNKKPTDEVAALQTWVAESEEGKFKISERELGE